MSNTTLLHKIGGIAAILIGWHLLSSSGIFPEIFIPPPWSAAASAVAFLGLVDFWQDLAYTAYRAILGITLGSIVGVPAGLIMGYSEKVYNTLEFIVEFFRSIPATALFPLFMLMFGVGDFSKAALAGWTCALVMTVSTMYGVHQAKLLRIRAAKILKIQGIDLFVKIVFPESLPQIFSGIRISLSLSLVVVVVAEMFIGTNVGLGKRIAESQQIYAVPEMYAAIFYSGLVGYILNQLAGAAERQIVHWKGK